MAKKHDHTVCGQLFIGVQDCSERTESALWNRKSNYLICASTAAMSPSKSSDCLAISFGQTASPLLMQT